jgi:hypothetical protein
MWRSFAIILHLYKKTPMTKNNKGIWIDEEGESVCNVNWCKNSCQHDCCDFHEGFHFWKGDNQYSIFHAKNTNNVYLCKRFFFFSINQKVTKVQRLGACTQ